MLYSVIQIHTALIAEQQQTLCFTFSSATGVVEFGQSCYHSPTNLQNHLLSSAQLCSADGSASL